MAKRATERATATAKNETATGTKPPRFANEAEEAAWWASPAGRRFTEEMRAASRSRGVVLYKGGFDDKARRTMRSGKAVYFEAGMKITPTDPARLEELAERAKAKATEQIALRLSVDDLAAAKRLAAKHGVGYQTLLKEIIHDALTRAS